MIPAVAVSPPQAAIFDSSATHKMSFVTRIRAAAKGPFSSFGASLGSLKGLDSQWTGFGAVRTATKRAGGTVHNHGGSPGKRLGVKKFSGAYCSHYPGDKLIETRL